MILSFSSKKTHKRNLFNRTVDTPIHNYLIEDNIINKKKNTDRKYFDWIVLNFCLKKKNDIEAWINMNIDTNINKYNSRTNNYQIIENFGKKIKSWIIPIKLLLFNLNETQGENESADQANFESIFSNQEKAIEENYLGSKKGEKKDKKQYRIEAKFCFFLKRYSHFQLR
ncbi:hypothetical protein UlMin_017689 [Ulmus minor]